MEIKIKYSKPKHKTPTSKQSRNLGQTPRTNSQLILLRPQKYESTINLAEIKIVQNHMNPKTHS